MIWPNWLDWLWIALISLISYDVWRKLKNNNFVLSSSPLSSSSLSSPSSPSSSFLSSPSSSFLSSPSSSPPSFLSSSSPSLSSLSFSVSSPSSSSLSSSLSSSPSPQLFSPPSSSLSSLLSQSFSSSLLSLSSPSFSSLPSSSSSLLFSPSSSSSAIKLDPATLVKLGPGSVLIKNALNKKIQTWLAKYAMHMDEVDPDGGFWFRDKQGKKLHLNATRSRGRIYQKLDLYPNKQEIINLCLQLVERAQGVLNLPSMTPEQLMLPSMTPTHLLLLYYTSANGIRWHRDTDPNDGDNLEPIVSISIGNSCMFGYKKYGKEKEYVKLESGDVVIWGGSERNLLHSVENVELNSAPKEIQEIIGNARVNFTFRSAPNILGFEKYYASQQYFIDEP